MSRHLLACLVLPVAALLASAAQAQSPYNTPSAQSRTMAAVQQDYIVPYMGYFDIGANDNSALQFGVEYRMAPRIWTLRPTFGINVSNDESIYGYAGVNWDIDLWQSGFWFTPNFTVGAYEDGDGKDLGGTIQFRSGLEVSYQFANQHRLGLAFNHISNASIYDKNPGAETLLINYHVPFNGFGGF